MSDSTPPAAQPRENSNLWRGIVSISVMAAFGVVTFVTMTKVVPESGITAQVVGSLTSLVSVVVSYWMGSSAGSTYKSEQLQAQQPSVVVQPPSTVTVQEPPNANPPARPAGS